MTYNRAAVGKQSRAAFVDQKMSVAKKGYLFLYNVAQALGWVYALYLILSSLYTSGGNVAIVYRDSHTVVGTSLSPLFFQPTPSSSHPSSSLFLLIDTFQFLASLEILHAALGLVGGSPLAALMQWAGRSNVLFGVVSVIPQVQSTPAVCAMFLAWAISEIIRYPWYACSVIMTNTNTNNSNTGPPQWLTWLRYTAFIPLYPIGVMGEMGAIWLALPLIKENKLRSVVLPNMWNFSFDYGVFLKLLLVVYPVLWWQLYSMLLRQRKKKVVGGGGGRKRD